MSPPPRLPRQPPHPPAADVAAGIVSHVEHEPLPVEDRRELAVELVDVATTHRAQVDVADVAVALLLSRQASRVLPVCITKRSFVPDRRRDDVTGVLAI